MEKIAVSLNAKRSAYKTLNVQNSMIVNGRLRLHLIDDGAKSLSVGDTIIVSRYFKEKYINPIIQKLTILEKVDDSCIIVNQPERTSVYRVSPSNDLNGVSWDGEKSVRIDFYERLNLYISDVAVTKRNKTLNPIILTFTNYEYPLDKVIVCTPRIVDGKENNSIIIKLTREQYDIVNTNKTTMTISTNEFYDVDYNSYCTLWGVNDDFSDVSYSVDNMFYQVPVFMGNEVDHVGLNSEICLTRLYEEEYKDKIIPEIIDLEKVKFTPMTITRAKMLKECNDMRFVFHFRSRADIEDDSSWTIDNDAEFTWNNGISEENMKSLEDTTVMESDLIGELGFNDDDVAYQKMKIKKSFIRLSFYSSKDITNQKLLFYSTVFLDSTELRGKYVKLLNRFRGEYEDLVSLRDGVEYDDRVTSEISIRNAYDTTKSSEGFYLYLFKTDDLTPNYENTEKTIYMKVEFNHAKYGRTIPMVFWPKDEDGNAEYLTPANYFDSLYVPVTLKYKDGKYLYYFEENVLNTTEELDSRLTFVLFEPRLTVQTERPKWT